MGLIKKNGYTVKGVELQEAYAKITRLYMDKGNYARTYFGISSNRENINNNEWLVELEFPCYVDKNEPIYEQVYVLAKDNLFRGWEDDIVVETPVEDPTPEIDDMMPQDMPQVGTVPETEDKEDNEVSTMPLEEEIVIEKDTNDKYFEDNGLDETTQDAVDEMNNERAVW